MPVDRKTTHQFFDRKLTGARRVEGKRHVGYLIEARDGRVLLPSLTISRGPSGEDITERNLKGLSDDLGMSLAGFVEACECRIGPDVVVYCAAVQVATQYGLQYELDRVAFDDGFLHSLEHSIAEWLKEPPARQRPKFSSKERKEIERASCRLNAYRNLEPIERIIKILNGYRESRFPQ